MLAPLESLAGGILIGLGAALLLLGNGRIAGISGIVGGAIRPGQKKDLGWRLLFLAGLVGGGGLALRLLRSQSPAPGGDSFALLVVAGLLVGFGTRLGNGCTSGHGVCGIGRFSRRSLVATLVFMASGATTVYLAKHVWSGGGAP
jgi:uncharacterized membrane protein YedE/YeeE